MLLWKISLASLPINPEQRLMTNNDVLRQLRYILDLDDAQIIALYKLADIDVTRAQVSNWLKKEEDPAMENIPDKALALFLNGLIIEKRGKREGPSPAPEDPLSNNMILQKLKIALTLNSDEIIQLFASVGKEVSKNELSAFFRNPDHKSYRPCMDQYLRSFLKALQAKYRP